ncbi:hypothetical protein AC1031_021552 [Aphanomyces cochlioides]|nr:hypothetical protein AC1031_021552 [Aphanomyces cochlioides]
MTTVHDVDDDGLWGRLAQPSFKYKIQEPKHGIEYITAIQDRSICESETPVAASHGHIVWDAAIALADYCQEAKLDCKHVLELGAGIGLVGMVLSAMGCPDVVLSDQRYCLPLLEKNIAENFPATHPSPPRTAELQWGDDKASAAFKNVDLIVASDVIYNSSVFPLLYQTLDKIASPSTVVLLCYEVRNADLEAEFFDGLRHHGYTCDEIAFSSSQVDYPEEIHLIRVQKTERHVMT